MEEKQENEREVRRVAEEWKEKEVYFDEKGRKQRISYSKDAVEKTAMKKPLKIDVVVKNGKAITTEELKEIMKKVDAIRNEQPLTEAHFIIKC